MSDGWPIRPSELEFLKVAVLDTRWKGSSLLHPPVSVTRPGATTLTVMPYWPSSIANALVSNVSQTWMRSARRP